VNDASISERRPRKPSGAALELRARLDWYLAASGPAEIALWPHQVDLLAAAGWLHAGDPPAYRGIPTPTIGAPADEKTATPGEEVAAQ
jgi:hypothetical protein